MWGHLIFFFFSMKRKRSAFGLMYLSGLWCLLSGVLWMIATHMSYGVLGMIASAYVLPSSGILRDVFFCEGWNRCWITAFIPECCQYISFHFFSTARLQDACIKLCFMMATGLPVKRCPSYQILKYYSHPTTLMKQTNKLHPYGAFKIHATSLHVACRHLFLLYLFDVISHRFMDRLLSLEHSICVV